MSVRRPYEWTAGRYTYRVVRMDEDLLEGQPGTWVGGFLHSHERDENIFIGSLRFPGRDLALSRKVASFVEIYGQRIPVEEIPQLTVIFSNPQVNGSPVSLQSVDAVYPQKVPDYAQTQWDEDRAVVTIGQPVPNRQERRVRLMTAGE